MSRTTSEAWLLNLHLFVTIIASSTSECQIVDTLWCCCLLCTWQSMCFLFDSALDVVPLISLFTHYVFMLFLSWSRHFRSPLIYLCLRVDGFSHIFMRSVTEFFYALQFLLYKWLFPTILSIQSSISNTNTFPSSIFTLGLKSRIQLSLIYQYFNNSIPFLKC